MNSMLPAERLEIVHAYGRLLESLAPYTIGDDNELPYSMKSIEEALIEEISLTIDPDLCRSLENAYLLLAAFVRTEECAAVRAVETWVREAAEGKRGLCEPIPQEKCYSEIQNRVNREMERRLQKVQELRARKVGAR